MKKLFKYTLSMVALCGALASCSDETTTDGIFNPNNGKELISLSGNDNGVTRAALTRGGFSAETKVEMRIKAINKNDASAKARYAEATATASAATGSDLSNLSYKSGLERYWDDAFGRESQLTIYAFAIPGQTSATLPTWSKSEWTAVDAQTNLNWYTSSADDTQVSWSVASEQTPETMTAQDLTYSNNISESGKGGRYAYKYENDAWTETKFGDGPLVWTAKTDNAGETTGKFDKGHLVFNHALAWIEINLKEGDGFNNSANTDFTWTKSQASATQNITLTGFNTEGTFDVAAGNWIEDNTLKSSLITQMDEKTGTPDKKTTRKLYAYVVPCTNLYETTTNVVEFEIDNAKYYVTGKQIAEAIRSYYANGEGKNAEKATEYQNFTTIKSGKHYVINLSVAKKSIERITAAIVDWETVNSDDADAKNTYPEFSLDDRGTKFNNSDITKFKLYRATKTAGDYITGKTEPNYDWKTGYSDKATKSWDATNSVWKTDWFWENNLTYYHFRAVGDVNNASAEPTFSINTDANNGDYFVIKSGTLNDSDYKDYIWGAPFKDHKGNLTYSTTDGFDNASDTNHQLSQAIGTTANDIKMLLFHMTSQITVNVKTTTDASKVTLKNDEGTTKVEILNILPNGKVLMGNGLVSTTSTDREESEMSAGSYTAESGTAGAKMEGFSFGIVPQPLTYSGGTIGLRITTPDGNQYIVKDLSTCTATVSANNLVNPYPLATATGNNYTINAWYPNYKYNYTVTIKKTGVERITAAVVNWEDVIGDLGTIDLEN